MTVPARTAPAGAILGAMLQPRRASRADAAWRSAAVAACAASWTLAACAVALQLVHRNAPVSVSYWLMDVLSAVAYGAVTLVLLPRTRHPVTWIVLLVGVGCGLSALVTQVLLLDGPGIATSGDLVVYLLGSASWLPGTYASMAVMPWLVSRTPQPLHRLMAVVGTGLVLLCLATLLTSPYGDSPGNPMAVGWEPWEWTMKQLGLWPDRAVLAVAALGALHLGRLWWQRRGTEETGYGWLAIGAVLLVLAFVPVFLLELDGEALEWSGVALILAQGFLPVALLVVVLRQQLWGVDVAVNRVAVWSLLTGSVVVGYAGLAWVAGMLLPQHNEAADLVSVGIVVALGQPLRHFIQSRVDHLVYGRGADPVRLLGALGRDITVEDRGSLESLVEALRDGLRLGGVEVRSVGGEVRQRAGMLGPDRSTFPLHVEGRHEGDLAVAALPGQRLDRRTVGLVEQLTGVLAVALQLARVNDRLEAASQRLTEVRVEERRMLRRDLHDGMGPALAGVALGLAAAQKRLGHDPEGTRALLAALETEVERRTDDLRMLARSLLPAQLDDGDLATALEVLRERFAGSGLMIGVHCHGVGDLDTKVQVALYHVAAEALMNAHRHAGASTVEIDVRAEHPGRTVLEVRDDGRGLPDVVRRGVGLSSMRERADELRGHLTVSPGPGGRGTCVRMELPWS